MIDNAIITQFNAITKYDLSQFLQSYADFIDQDRDQILNYYKGRTDIDFSAFTELKRLLSEIEEINTQVGIYKHQLSNVQFWELIDFLDDIHRNLQTVNNSSKWLRSSITSTNLLSSGSQDITLRQRQTLEGLVSELGSDDVEDWVGIALDNDLAEEDYSPEGGAVVRVVFRNKKQLFLKAVVDNIIGERAYGLDLNKKLTFTSNDLEVLSYKDTILQAVNILATLKKGDTPEFPEDGVQASVIIGSNRNSIPFPSLFRQIYATFIKDDTLKSLTISNVEYIEDGLKIEFTVQTRIGEAVVEQTIL